MESLQAKELNRAKELLAYEVTALVHGETRPKAEQTARSCSLRGPRPPICRHVPRGLVDRRRHRGCRPVLSGIAPSKRGAQAHRPGRRVGGRHGFQTRPAGAAFVVRQGALLKRQKVFLGCTVQIVRCRRKALKNTVAICVAAIRTPGYVAGAICAGKISSAV